MSDMRRRQFITLLGSAAAAWPLAARAQQTDQMRRIGILMPYAASDIEIQAHLRAFRQELQRLGWTEAATSSSTSIGREMIWISFGPTPRPFWS
jgi:hypothetical protein